MNRDEKLSRPAGLSPIKRNVNGRVVLCPSEASGGTWIATNNSGATVALINWYSIAARVQCNAISRGEVVNAVSTAGSPDVADVAFGELALNRINPFRLIGIYPASGEVMEWRWDLKRLVRKSHPWKTQQWISSGFDELAAQHVRGKIFRLARRQHSAASLVWLRRLHRSHAPQAGPFSTCMHRIDAATVSYTEVSVSSTRTKMLFHAGPPCKPSECPLDIFHPPSCALPESAILKLTDLKMATPGI